MIMKKDIQIWVAFLNMKLYFILRWKMERFWKARLNSEFSLEEQLMLIKAKINIEMLMQFICVGIKKKIVLLLEDIEKPFLIQISIQ